MRSRPTFSFLSAAALLAAACSGDGTSAVRPDPNAPAALAFIVQPSAEPTVNKPIAPAVQVEVRDAAGQRAAGATNRVTLGLTDQHGSDWFSGAPPAATAVNGVATFPGLAVAGAITDVRLVATSPGLAGATSAAFDVSWAPVASVRVEPSDTSVILGGPDADVYVYAHAFDADGDETVGCTPTWASSDPGVATAEAVPDDFGQTYALVHGVSVGVAAVTFTLRDCASADTFSGTAEVSVYDPADLTTVTSADGRASLTYAPSAVGAPAAVFITRGTELYPPTGYVRSTAYQVGPAGLVLPSGAPRTLRVASDPATAGSTDGLHFVRFQQTSTRGIWVGYGGEHDAATHTVSVEIASDGLFALLKAWGP